MKIWGVCSSLALFVPASHVIVDASQAAAAASTQAVAWSDALKHIDWRYFVAGGTCAAISHGITTPIDVVKTKIQANPQQYNRGMLAATADICKHEGPQVLLGGLGPTVVGYGIEGAMKFGVYEVMKPIATQFLRSISKTAAASDPSSHSPAAFLLASLVAGAVAALLLCPMESTRIRIVTDPAYANQGLWTGLPKLMREQGWTAPFAGLWAMLAKQVPYTFGKQVSFDVVAQILYREWIPRIQDYLASGQDKWLVSVVAALGASLVACLFSQPGDMILTETYRPQKRAAIAAATATETSKDKLVALKRRLQHKIVVAEPPSPPAPMRSFSQVVSEIYQTGGMAQFFTGTGPRIVHVGLIITSQLVLYDIVKQALGLPATGSH
jgi:solute carrier family 25 (mitochondrial phosphate transporter), member 3